MAKSIRSKSKRAFRAKKREEGIYAATEAARLQRLNSKIKAKLAPQDVEIQTELPHGDETDELRAEEPVEGLQSSTHSEHPATMDVDPSATSTPGISTHGPRNSRREAWRTSKGLTARPKPRGSNRQGGVAARRNSGRAHRRR